MESLRKLIVNDGKEKHFKENGFEFKLVGNSR